MFIACSHRLIWRKCRIHVFNHSVGLSAKRRLYATLLLSNFEVHRHITVIPVAIWIRSARRPASSARGIRWIFSTQRTSEVLRNVPLYPTRHAERCQHSVHPSLHPWDTMDAADGSSCIYRRGYSSSCSIRCYGRLQVCAQSNASLHIAGLSYWYSTLTAPISRYILRIWWL